eukprot:836559-Pyramimonas_sp.AAC.1
MCDNSGSSCPYAHCEEELRPLPESVPPEAFLFEIQLQLGGERAPPFTRQGEQPKPSKAEAK